MPISRNFFVTLQIFLQFTPDPWSTLILMILIYKIELLSLLRNWFTLLHYYYECRTFTTLLRSYFLCWKVILPI